MERPRKFIIATLSIRMLGSSSVPIIIIIIIISTDEDLSLRIERFAPLNLVRGVSTKLYFNLIFAMQTYKELINVSKILKYDSNQNDLQCIFFQ